MYANKLIDLYSDGLRLEDIARKLNISSIEVKAGLKAYKVEQQSKDGSKHVYTQEFKEVLLDRYVRGVKFSTIGREMSITMGRVSELVQDTGFAIDAYAIEKTI
ncbi:hypothetical protein PP657_gp041 [Bacillus phage BCPST]|uniref:Uncharacterized protein n=3 Tax=Yihwangvirus TaxID=3044863 RepID=A0AAE7P4T8_9CAUD|nr:hypothetical protein PP655_gp053 [Bacillus phage PBC4]YP_010657216.1 hypothetical protein PP656_gp060 [Bacillus phage pW4]YP_010657294.1 hypothetical protein PP657_gp041 [Bacillus phage BCPST]QSJ04250.1 hypothetical protein BCP6_045 [Bacillus phage BCP6]WEM05676.1 hypothetical protein BSG01_037 [Bacillus phage BSG01]AKQ08245.1 hypothetical protein PBC4_053 [Bacillus phage PBC4]AZU99094.1 hypothetical protein pW4_79 [Bacillus phage pW4]QQO38659.1 hypothetical protein BCPST_041 [Bacillus ph